VRFSAREGNGIPPDLPGGIRHVHTRQFFGLFPWEKDPDPGLHPLILEIYLTIEVNEETEN
jgi:hypothetical protein